MATGDGLRNPLPLLSRFVQTPEKSPETEERWRSGRGRPGGSLPLLFDSLWSVRSLILKPVYLFNHGEALRPVIFYSYRQAALINARLLPLTLGGHQRPYIKGLTSANLAKLERPPAAKKGEPSLGGVTLQPGKMAAESM